MNDPHRHDFEVFSCVNSLEVFSRKVQKKMENFNHTVMIDVELSREHFTRHDLRVNSSGKGRRSYGIGLQKYVKYDQNIPHKEGERAHHPDMEGKTHG
jgi:hypothetical protein